MSDLIKYKNGIVHALTFVGVHKRSELKKYLRNYFNIKYLDTGCFISAIENLVNENKIVEIKDKTFMKEEKYKFNWSRKNG